MSDADLDVLGGVATPSDYLEKIFQIPLWLRPIPAARRPAIISALLERHVDDEAGKIPFRDATATAIPREPAPVPGSRADSGRLAFASRNKQMGSVQINSQELEFLPRIAPLIDGNARALKRFANTYHLVKAALPDVESRTFEKNLPYRVCMAQLAVLATQRRRARILVTLCDQSLGDDKPTLGAWLEKHRNSQEPEVSSLATDLSSALTPELQDLPFSQFTLWLERTRRYSFYL